VSDDVTLGELKRWLDRIEKKLDTVTQDHENRIRRAERFVYIVSGLALAGSGVSSFITFAGV
jgi:hypothetical protein